MIFSASQSLDRGLDTMIRVTSTRGSPRRPQLSFIDGLLLPESSHRVRFQRSSDPNRYCPVRELEIPLVVDESPGAHATRL
jgi:hypothetical protein